MSVTTRYKTEIRFPKEEVDAVAQVMGNVILGVVKGAFQAVSQLGKAGVQVAKAVHAASSNTGSSSGLPVAEPVAPQVRTHEANVKETPCMEILRLAMEKAARDHGGTIGRAFQNSIGGERPCLLSLSLPTFRRGIGAVIDRKGNLSFAYDAVGCDVRAIERLCKEISQNYAVIAMMRVHSRHGYSNTVENTSAADGAKKAQLISVRA